MTQMTRRLFAFVAAITFTALLAGPAANAQTAAAPTGTITGRVFNTVTGQYLNNARVTIPGSNITAQTDDTGTYLLARVPLGEVTLEIFYTGMEPKRITLALDSPSATIPDIEFTAADRRVGTRDSAEDIIQLEKYTVSDRTMDGAAIAINEQRFAPNLVTVVSTDEYGIVPDGNVGEFLKMLPGITMSYRQGDPREVEINGVSSSNVPVSIDGFDLASSEISGSGRNVELNSVSINTLSRVEVSFSPTPETRGDALAGAVNLIPRTSFERRKPLFTATTYLAFRTNTPELRTPGPRSGSTYKIRPGFDFSWTMPVTRNFGFSISAGASFQYKETSGISPQWRGNANPTNENNPTATNKFPDTTPGNPYLSQIQLFDTLAENTRTSFAISADWRFARDDVLSFRFNYSSFNSKNTQRNLFFTLTNITAGNFSSGQTTGTGRIDSRTDYNNRYTQTLMPSLRWRHTGPVWKTDTGLGWSDAQQRFRNTGDGTFRQVVARRGSSRITFNSNNLIIDPSSITVVDNATGAPVNPYDINSYFLHSADSQEPTNATAKLTAYANAERVLPLRIPASMKVGLDYRTERKDKCTANTTWNYLGSSGAQNVSPSTSTNYAAPYNNPDYRQNAYLYGFPTLPTVDNIAIYNTSQTSPDFFDTLPNYGTDYTSTMTASFLAKEKIASAYLRLDFQLLDGRLKLTGGLRVERTEDQGWGPLLDPDLTPLTKTIGNTTYGFTHNVNGKQVPYYVYTERGSYNRVTYTTPFPSINASYTLFSNTIIRAAAYQSIGRPDFTQYTGGIDINTDSSDQSYLDIKNPKIKPWHANSYKLQFEHYFQKVGTFSIGMFKRDYTDFFSEVTYEATTEELQALGLNPDVFGTEYMIRAQDNIPGTMHTYGLDLNYKQALTFLPNWARGVQVIANWSWIRVTNAGNKAQLGAFTPRAGNLGLSLSRPKYNLRLNLTYQSRTRQGLVTGHGIPDFTYNYRGERFFMDLRGEYSLTGKIAMFASVSGIALTKETEDTYVIGPDTPKQATLNQRGGNTGYYPLWTIGIKGKW